MMNNITYKTKHHIGINGRPHRGGPTCHNE